MRKALILAAVIAAFCLPTIAIAGCNADQAGGLVCGEGKDAIRVFSDTTSPSKKFAFGWRTSAGLPSGRNLPSGDIENVLIRIDDGAVLAKLGGEYWTTGDMIANRYEQLAVWSADSRAVVEVANSRWDTDSFAYYAIDGDKATKLDLLALVSPAVKAKLPASQREGHSFRVRENLPVKLDARGHLSCTVMLYVPKSDPILNYTVAVDISSKAGAPAARIVSIRRVKVDPRL